MDSLPCRKTIRLQNYDYSQNGAYFVTICTALKEPLFGVVCRGDPCGRPPVPAYVEYTPLGEIACQTFAVLDSIYPVSVPCFVVMPDHVHAIIMLERRATARVAPTLGRVVGAYKSKVCHQWLAVCKRRGIIMGEIWQRGYYEHVLRSQQDFDGAAQYIRGNPARWAEGGGRVLCGCPPDPLVCNPN